MRDYGPYLGRWDAYYKVPSNTGDDAKGTGLPAL